MLVHVPADPVHTPELAVLNRTIGVLFSGYTCSMVLYGFVFFRQFVFATSPARKLTESQKRTLILPITPTTRTHLEFW